jgi:hypothetical protein
MEKRKKEEHQIRLPREKTSRLNSTASSGNLPDLRRKNLSG